MDLDMQLNFFAPDQILVGCNKFAICLLIST
jgi:hypothetical protein